MTHAEGGIAALPHARFQEGRRPGTKPKHTGCIKRGHQSPSNMMSHPTSLVLSTKTVVSRCAFLSSQALPSSAFCVVPLVRQ